MYTREWLKIVKEVKKLKKRYVNNLILLIIALIWGAAFVAQSAGMDYIGPFTFNSARSILGGIVLIPVIYVLLLISSLLSIPIECSAAGESVRQAMKAEGKNIDQFDIMSNWGRSFLYLCVWAGYLDAETGGVLACVCIGAAMLLGILRFR